MTTFDPVAALDLPHEAIIARRVPKTLLIQNGAFAAGDQRRIRESVHELMWHAALKPATVGVAEYRDDNRDYLEIAVLTLTLRPGARSGRLVELIHRSVPYPVLLITSRHETPEFSLAHKRRSLGEADKTVIDGEIVAAPVPNDCPAETLAAFRNALALQRQPRQTLRDLYQGWVDTVQAFRAASITGGFRLSLTAAAASARESALRKYVHLNDRIEKMHNLAGTESQMSRRAEINVELARLRADRDAARARL